MTNSASERRNTPRALVRITGLSTSSGNSDSLDSGRQRVDPAKAGRARPQLLQQRAGAEPGEDHFGPRHGRIEEPGVLAGDDADMVRQLLEQRQTRRRGIVQNQ